MSSKGPEQSNHDISPGQIVCYSGGRDRYEMQVQWSSLWNYCPYCGGDLDV